ncbi:ASCH domain protein [Vibrio phage 1.086.O._10N.222.51.F8]|nr:ASCH domain protein [Vibrio phage 1.086.O._10N.222.51.F8]
MNINGKEIARGLIVDEPWISKILSGEKTWEMRSTKTKVRGEIALIKKGSGTIVGTVEIYDCMACDPEKLPMAISHCIPSSFNVFEKWNVAWKLRGAKEIKPIPYNHKQGAVIWVKL